MATSSASITFAFSTGLAEATSFDKVWLSRRWLDSKQVCVTCVWIQVRLEVIEVVMLFNVSELCWRSARTVRDKLQKVPVKGICIFPEVPMPRDVLALPRREEIHPNR